MRKAAQLKSKGSAVRFAPTIGWIVEEGSVRVFQVGRGELLKLGYPEAAVWDLIGRCSREDKIAPKLAAIAGLPAPAARTLLRSCVRRWIQAGILVETGGRG